MQVSEAIAQLLAAVKLPELTETVSLLDADNRVLAVDVKSGMDVPGFDNSAMDGYALSAEAAVGAVFTVTQRIAAGQVGQPLLPGEAARIFTGAPVPPGTVAVVMQEHASEEGGQLTLSQPARVGQHIRRSGEDIAAGQVVVAEGERLLPAQLSLIASIGEPLVTVYRKPSVGLLFTGDELTEPGQPLPPGGIYNSNRYALSALLKRLGCEVTDLGQVPDRLDATQAVLREAAGHYDVLISSGGVSVGEEDHVKAALQTLGELHLWRLAMKPGKPLAFGRIGATHFVGLPGNPVSSFVTLLMVVRPFLLALQGQRHVTPQPQTLPAAFNWPRPDKRREFLRARINGDGQLSLFDNQGSGVMTSLAWADGLVELPPETVVQQGDRVRYWPLSTLY
ncbi:molybdopterin molybdotransferase MoeA [Leeia sp. IMCC25680]|uniref:Molybdopterin molybdenumtransferase n=2 Tax=Leeia aquatica TaxID=2725557 RepID=A0A847S457_9NEIS|nr:molybdopterin molybdotransferase MoeA [Leeia aquatica]